MPKYSIALILLFIFSNNALSMTPPKNPKEQESNILEYLENKRKLDRSNKILKLKEEIEFLLASNIDVNNKRWILALNNCAYYHDCHDQLKLLLERGINPNHKSSDALYGACYSGAIENVKLLLEYKADPNRLGMMYMETPLIRSLRSGYLEIFNLLLKAGADPNIQDELGFTPLIHACKKDTFYLIAIQKTLFGLSNPDIFDNPPPLDIEDLDICNNIEAARKKFVLALLEADAKINIKCGNKNAINYAYDNELPEIVELLKNKLKMVKKEKAQKRRRSKKKLMTEQADNKISGKLQKLGINLQKCNTCHKTPKEHGIKLFTCGTCKAIYYCSRECQKMNWNHHKKICGEVD